MEETKSKGSGRKKWIFIVLGILAGFILILQLVVMFYIDPKAEAYIVRKVYERSHKQYTVRFENVSINVFTQSIEAKSVYLTPTPASDSIPKIRPDEVELFVPEIKAHGLNIWKALWDKKVVVSSISVEAPKIKIKRNSRTDANPAQYRHHRNYYRLLKGWFNAALVKDVSIKGGYLELYRLLDQFEYVATIENVDLHFTDVLLDSTVSDKENGYLDFGSVSSTIKGYSQRSPDSTYLLSVGSIQLSSDSSYFHVKDINLTPLVKPDAEDLKNVLYEVYAPTFNLDNIDLKNLYKTRELYLPAVKVMSPAIKVMGNNVMENRKDSVEEVNFYPLISEYIKTFHIAKILLDDAKLSIVNTKENIRKNIPSADIFLYDFRMDSSLLVKRNNLFYSQKVFIKTEDYPPVLIDSMHIDKDFLQGIHE